MYQLARKHYNNILWPIVFDEKRLLLMLVTRENDFMT